MKKESILITGASGFIGGFLVAEALRQGFEVWAAVRRTSSRECLTDERIRFIELDLSDRAALEARLAAHVANVDDSYCYSNVITLPVVVSYRATMPTEVYVAASSIHGGTEGKALAPVYGMEGQWFGMVYMAAGASLTWGDADSQTNGYALTTAVNDQANAETHEAADGGIEFTNAGWYVLHFTASVADNMLNSTLTVYPGAAYTTGAPSYGEGDWLDGDASKALTAPADASGEWVSPAFIAGGELRAYIKVPGLDWWRTEFTLYQGNLYWRDRDIPGNWAENVGSDYSVSCDAGARLYVNFDYDTGRVE